MNPLSAHRLDGHAASRRARFGAMRERFCDQHVPEAFELSAERMTRLQAKTNLFEILTLTDEEWSAAERAASQCLERVRVPWLDGCIRHAVRQPRYAAPTDRLQRGCAVPGS
jgi:hypothetical protein